MTERHVKMADIAAKLDTTPTSIADWIKRHKEHFSDGAKMKSGRRRVFDESDLIVLATIAELSHNNVGHDEITDHLKKGYRVESFESINYGVNRTLIPEDAVTPLVDASRLQSEVESLLEQRDQLLERLERMEETYRKSLEAKDEEIKNMNERLADLQRELGRLEGRIEERDKKRRWF